MLSLAVTVPDSSSPAARVYRDVVRTIHLYNERRVTHVSVIRTNLWDTRPSQSRIKSTGFHFVWHRTTYFANETVVVFEAVPGNVNYDYGSYYSVSIYLPPCTA